MINHWIMDCRSLPNCGARPSDEGAASQLWENSQSWRTHRTSGSVVRFRWRWNSEHFQEGGSNATQVNKPFLNRKHAATQGQGRGGCHLFRLNAKCSSVIHGFSNTTRLSIWTVTNDNSLLLFHSSFLYFPYFYIHLFFSCWIDTHLLAFVFNFLHFSNHCSVS